MRSARCPLLLISRPLKNPNILSLKVEKGFFRDLLVVSVWFKGVSARRVRCPLRDPGHTFLIDNALIEN